MSFLGGNNQSRPNQGNQQVQGERGPRSSDTTFLGEANQLLSKMPEAPPPTTFGSEARPLAGGTSTQAGPTPAERCTNVIAAGAKWQGTLTVDDSVRVEGVFAGEIQAKGTVHVADGAEVNAKVRAMFVVVSGNFRGEIRCDQRVDLLPRSRVNGEVITKILSVQEGAVLDGRVQMTGSTEAGETTRIGSRSARAATAELEVSGERRNDRNAEAVQANANRGADG